MACCCWFSHQREHNNNNPLCQRRMLHSCVCVAACHATETMSEFRRPRGVPLVCEAEKASIAGLVIMYIRCVCDVRYSFGLPTSPSANEVAKLMQPVECNVLRCVSLIQIFRSCLLLG